MVNIIKPLLVVLGATSVAALKPLTLDNVMQVVADKRHVSRSDVEDALARKHNLDTFLFRLQDWNNAHSVHQNQLNLGWGGTVSCNTKCPGCAQCATDLGNASIDILGAFALACIACAFGPEACVPALATAAATSTAIQARFCNGQHQSVTCLDDCNWWNSERC